MKAFNEIGKSIALSIAILAGAARFCVVVLAVFDLFGHYKVHVILTLGAVALFFYFASIVHMVRGRGY